jgi:hypothetical protein
MAGAMIDSSRETPFAIIARKRLLNQGSDGGID